MWPPLISVSPILTTNLCQLDSPSENVPKGSDEGGPKIHSPPVLALRSAVPNAPSSDSESEDRSKSPVPTYSPQERRRALRDWLSTARGGEFAKSPLLLQIQHASRQSAQPASRLLQWTKFTMQIYSAGPADDSAPPPARGQPITKQVVGMFLRRGHDWVKHALRAQEAIEEGHPKVMELVEQLVIKGCLLGAKTLSDLCHYAVTHNQVPTLPKRGRGGAAGDSSSSEPDDGNTPSSGEGIAPPQGPQPSARPRPRPRPFRRHRIPMDGSVRPPPNESECPFSIAQVDRIPHIWNRLPHRP